MIVMNRAWVLGLILAVIAFSTSAQARGPQILGAPVVEEVSEAEAARILGPSAQRAQQRWMEEAQQKLKQSKSSQEASKLRSSSQIQSFDVITGIVGAIIIDQIVNIGKAIWDVIKAGRGTVDITQNSANAVPKGVTDWTQLEGWKAPVSKLYRAQLLVNNGQSLGDFYFRLNFIPGGSIGGKGKFIANVTVLPAQITVPYRTAFNASVSVANIVNHGTKKDPVAGMELHFVWGVDRGRYHTEQALSFHITGDGLVEVLAGEDEVATDVQAPVSVRPNPAPAPTPGRGTVSTLPNPYPCWDNPFCFGIGP